MALVDDLLNEIDADLGASVSRSTQNSKAVEDLFEAFLFGLVLRAARSIDANAVAWENLTGVNGDEVRLRAGPGEVFSSTFSFATLSFSGDLVFELHQGVRVEGSSSVAHECDVATFHAGRLAWRRGRNERPGPVDTFMAIEAKAYAATSIGLGIGRGVVGLRSDLQQWRTALVAAGPIDASVEKLIHAWATEAFADVMPGTTEADDLVTYLETLLQS
jgi:hypothetical protein